MCRQKRRVFREEKNVVHLADGLKDSLIMGVHLSEGLDLRQVDVLSVTEGNDLIKGEDELEGLLDDFRLLHLLAVLRDLCAS